MINIILPSGYQVEISRLRQQLDEAHFAWWKEWKSQQPDFKIENIRHKHDPQWRNRAFSIQSAHDHNHWIWKATHIAFGWTVIR